MLLENFKKQVYSGLVTEQKITEMLDSGNLSEKQIEILQEAGLWAGLKNAAGTAKNLAGNAMNNAAQAVGNAGRQFNQNYVQPVKNSFEQGRTRQIQKNELVTFIKNYKRYMEPQIDKLLNVFQGNQTAVKGVANMARWISYMSENLNSANQLGIALPTFVIPNESHQSMASSTATNTAQQTQQPVNNTSAASTQTANPSTTSAASQYANTPVAQRVPQQSSMATQTANPATTTQTSATPPKGRVRQKPTGVTPNPKNVRRRKV